MRIKGKSPKLLEKEEWARGENGREKRGARGEKEITHLITEVKTKCEGERI